MIVLCCAVANVKFTLAAPHYLISQNTKQRQNNDAIVESNAWNRLTSRSVAKPRERNNTTPMGRRSQPAQSRRSRAPLCTQHICRVLACPSHAIYSRECYRPSIPCNRSLVSSLLGNKEGVALFVPSTFHFLSSLKTQLELGPTIHNQYKS